MVTCDIVAAKQVKEVHYSGVELPFELVNYQQYVGFKHYSLSFEADMNNYPGYLDLKVGKPGDGGDTRLMAVWVFKS